MQFLNGTYATRYNAAHERAGHVFQGRFHDELVRRHDHLLEAIRYIALNPVRAGLARRPELWRWSSYGGTVGVRPPQRWVHHGGVLALFDTHSATARVRCVEFVNAGLSSTGRPALSDLLNQESGAGVARARDDYGYTQAEIAAHLGVSQPTISRMIARERRRE
jgi:hypothetical protein